MSTRLNVRTITVGGVTLLFHRAAKSLCCLLSKIFEDVIIRLHGAVQRITKLGRVRAVDMIA